MNFGSGICRSRLLFFKKPIDDSQKHQYIVFIQLIHPLDRFLNQFGICRIFIKKLLWCNFKIFAYRKKLFHRRECFAR